MKICKVKVSTEDEKLIPAYKTDGAAGCDLISNEEGSIEPGMSKTISTGLFVEIEPGYEMQIRPRSGLAAKYSITVLNTPGTIDCDYRGEVKVILQNLGSETFEYKKYDRIAQAVFAPVTKAMFIKVSSNDELSKTERGEGGFGSTGV